MRNRIFVALFAATALVPVAAFAAQRTEGRGSIDMQRRDAERGPGWNRDQQRTDRRFDREGRRPGSDEWLREREQQRTAPPPPDLRNPAERAPDRREWRDRDDQRDRRPSQPQDRRWNMTNDSPRPIEATRPDRDDRRDDRWQRRDDRRDDRGDRRRYWSNDSRDQRYDWRNVRHDGARWDNGWRRNDRYDWRNYRARNRHIYHLPRYYAPRGWDGGYRRFRIGVVIGPVLYNSGYWIGDPGYYRLPPVYGPYRWVRYYNDALLVDLRSGIVVDTVYDIFW